MDPTLGILSPPFRRHLLATNRSRATVTTYVSSIDRLREYLEAHPTARGRRMSGVRAGIQK